MAIRPFCVACGFQKGDVPGLETVEFADWDPDWSPTMLDRDGRIIEEEPLDIPDSDLHSEHTHWAHTHHGEVDYACGEEPPGFAQFCNTHLARGMELRHLPRDEAVSIIEAEMRAAEALQSRDATEAESRQDITPRSIFDELKVVFRHGRDERKRFRS